jgi:hypothetical protein
MVRSIKLNEDFRDDGQDCSAKIRLRCEILLIILEDLELQSRLLHVGRSKTLSLSQLERLVNSMNRIEYHLQELESPIQEAL